MKKSEVLILVIVLAVGTVILVTVLALLHSSGPANIVILDTDSVWEGSSLIVSGRLINSGQTKSNPVILEISLTDANNNPLGTVNTAPTPSIIEPGMEATFSKDVSPEIGEYNGNFHTS